MSLENNMILAQDPALPRTKDYSCKNLNCITHQDKKSKEAVFYREPNSFKLNYLCTVCNFSWSI